MKLTEEEKEQYASENFAYIHYFTRKYHKPPWNYDDLLGAATLGMTKALNTFDKDKGVKFSTYSARCITNAIFYFMRHEKKHLNNISLDQPLNTDEKGNEMTLLDTLVAPEEEESVWREISPVVNVILKGLSGRKRKIMDLFFENKTQREIAKEVGFSQSYVSRIIEKVLSKIKVEYWRGERDMPKIAFSMSPHEYVDLVSKHTIREVAKIKGISEGTLYNWIKANKGEINELLSREETPTETAQKAPEKELKVSEIHITDPDKTNEYKAVIAELKAQMESSTAAKDVIIEGLEKKVEYWKTIADNDNQKVMELKAALNDSKEQAKETALTNLALGIKVNVLEEQLDEKTKRCQELQTEYNELFEDYSVLKEEVTPLRQLVLINMREKVGILT